jgi:acetoacetate decarboxylase
MATITGKLNPKDQGQVVPIHAPAYVPQNTLSFGDVDTLVFNYITDADSVAAVLPTALEIDEKPIATAMFVSYGISGVGTYNEFVQQVACKFQGEDVQYTLHIYVDNEPAMLAGREWLGWPKLLAEIPFDTRRPTKDGLISASVERPAGLPLANGLFRPLTKLEGVPMSEFGSKNINMRVIPSAVPGQPPVVREWVCTTMTPNSGEVWMGEGSLQLTGASDFAPLHRAPVVKMLDSLLIRNSDVTLTCPTETIAI